jgi:hypothetical protein
MLPFEQDGVQDILSRIVKTTTTDVELHRIMTTVWYLWKARNDLRDNPFWDNEKQITSFAGSNLNGAVTHGLSPSNQVEVGFSSNFYICRLPTLLEGPRPYSDAEFGSLNRRLLLAFVFLVQKIVKN